MYRISSNNNRPQIITAILIMPTILIISCINLMFFLIIKFIYFVAFSEYMNYTIWRPRKIIIYIIWSYLRKYGIRPFNELVGWLFYFVIKVETKRLSNEFKRSSLSHDKVESWISLLILGLHGGRQFEMHIYFSIFFTEYSHFVVHYCIISKANPGEFKKSLAWVVTKKIMQ